MSWDFNYALPWQDLDVAKLEAEAKQLAADLGGLRYELAPREEGAVTLGLWVSRALVERHETLWWLTAAAPNLSDADQTLLEHDRSFARECLEAGSFRLDIDFRDDSAGQGVTFRKDIGRCRMHVPGNQWGPFAMLFTEATSHVLESLVVQLGAVADAPLPPRPDEVTQAGPLADLRRMVDALGDVPPAWGAAYASGGDVDGALARLWAGATLTELVPFVSSPDVNLLAQLGLDAWKLVFGAKKLKKTWHPSVPEVVNTIEWWLDGSAMLPAVSRVARWLPDIDADDARALALLVSAIALSKNDPRATAGRVQEMFLSLPDAVLQQHGAALAVLVRERLKTPTVETLQRVQVGGGGGGGARKKRATKKVRAPTGAVAGRLPAETLAEWRGDTRQEDAPRGNAPLTDAR